ncbi:MAG: hypothetical protein RLZ45_308 [Verrucomicrobiota bacterium]|jgi:hypothetical protein
MTCPQQVPIPPSTQDLESASGGAVALSHLRHAGMPPTFPCETHDLAPYPYGIEMRPPGTAALP